MNAPTSGATAPSPLVPRPVHSTAFVDITALTVNHVRDRLGPDAKLTVVIEEAVRRGLRIHPNVKIHCPSVFSEIGTRPYSDKQAKDPLTYVQFVMRNRPNLVPLKGGHQHCVDGYYYFTDSLRPIQVVAAQKPAVVCTAPHCPAAYMPASASDLANGECSSCESTLATPPAPSMVASGLANVFNRSARQASRYVGAVFAYTYPNELVSVIDGAGDGGIDVTCASDDGAHAYTRLIQVKAHAAPVGPEAVRALHGTVRNGAAPDAVKVLVSLSGFTSSARGLAAQHGIVCLDQEQIDVMLDGLTVNTGAELDALCAQVRLFQDRVGPTAH